MSNSAVKDSKGRSVAPLTVPQGRSQRNGKASAANSARTTAAAVALGGANGSRSLARAKAAVVVPVTPAKNGSARTAKASAHKTTVAISTDLPAKQTRHAAPVSAKPQPKTAGNGASHGRKAPVQS